jgi:hypothetical protein
MEAIDRAEIWPLSTRKPHEHDVLANSLFDETRGIQPLCVGVDNDLGKHFGVVTISATARISTGKDLVVQPIYRRMDDTTR